MTDKKATVVVGLGYGDEGKGAEVDYLCRIENARLVVRFGGGSQAAHNVISPFGYHHTFSQVGSGMMTANVKTFLSRYMLINPLLLLEEMNKLEEDGFYNIASRVYIDKNALVITPYQHIANQIKELARSNNKHGSCGHGIGECKQDYLHDDYPNLRIRYLGSKTSSKTMLKSGRALKYDELLLFLKGYDNLLPATAQAINDCMSLFYDDEFLDQMVDFYEQFYNSVIITESNTLQVLIDQTDHVVFEGAQGVLLDEKYGFAPHVTWTDTTSRNAYELLDDCDFDGEIKHHGLIRAYATKHGAGFFPTESIELTDKLHEQHNIYNQWQDNMRVGWFDAPIINYSIGVLNSLGQPIDGLVVSNVDRLFGFNQIPICENYYHTNSLNSAEKIYNSAISVEEDWNQNLKRTVWMNITKKPDYIYHGFSGPLSHNPFDSTREYLNKISSLLGKPIIRYSVGPKATDRYDFNTDGLL